MGTKVRLSITGATLVVELEDAKARNAFKELAGQLLILGPREAVLTKSEQQHLVEQACEFIQEKKTELDNTDRELDKELEQEIDSQLEVSDSYDEPSTGYGGFLYIKCPDCGEIKGFCAKVRIHNFRCGCGSVTRLEHLVPLYMNCECGRKSRYLTNMTESMFDMTCYDCGSPVAITWNDNKKQYETIRG